ncbi:unnamed protein product [Orchesella dallaii]|uniref:C2H2-type domain-containing protein n=1 Tax=Orchesella dallaii TaxID=48710 RepID=A0ABP1RLB5_9HEXA
MSCTVNLCTFCYCDNPSVSVSEAGKLNCETNREEILNQFLKLTQRYFGSSFQSKRSRIGIQGRDGDKFVLNACSDCLCEVETFCKLYHEWKCLEMEMEWRLRKLSSVIDSTNAVAMFNPKIYAEERRLLQSFRNEFQQKCSKRCSMSFPRVILENLMHPTKCEVSKVVELKPQVLLETRTTQFSQMFLGWISTFTAVLLLGNLFLERNATTNDFGDYKPIICTSLDPVSVDANYDGDDDDECVSSADNKHEPHLANQFLPILNLETNSVVNSSLIFETSSTPKPVMTQHQKPYLPPIGSSLQPHEIRLRAPDFNPQHVHFRCFRCGRSFNRYYTLLRHRRAFTHRLAKRKTKTRLLEVKILQQKPECSDRQINVGILRPLHIKRNIVARNNDPEGTSEESENGDTSDVVDDDWNSSTTKNDDTISGETSIKSSNNNDEPEFSCSNCAKNFSNASARTGHEKICRFSVNQTITTATGAAPVNIKTEKKYHCDRSSCNYKFATEPQLLAHQRLHGNFTCKNCSVIKDFAPALAIHELTHQQLERKNKPKYAKNEWHLCPRCNVHTNSQKNYISHFIWAHLKLRSGIDLCSICKAPLLTTASKNAHFLRQHDTKGVDPKFIRKCEQCPAYFLKAKQLRCHLNMIHDCSDEMSTDDEEQVRLSSNSNKCVKCGKIFKRKSIFLKHNESCTRAGITKKAKRGMRRFICDHKACKRRFNFEEELEAHKKYHGKFPCQFCNVVKTYAPNLAVHERIHARKRDKSKGGQEFYCPRCNFKCKHKLSYYIRHYLETHLGLPGKRVMCHVCKTLFSSNSYSSHYRVCHKTDGVDPAAIRNCNQCPAYFLKDSQLSAHIKQTHDTNHQKLRGKFPCSVCPVVKTYAPELALHEATHFTTSFLSPTSMKRSAGRGQSFKCSRCPSTVNGKFNYVTHFLEKHLNLAPEGVTCQNCGETFTWRKRSLLGRHIDLKHDIKGMLEHDISRCDHCPAFFCKPIFLFHHKKKFHHNDIINACVDCGRTYSTPGALRTHRLGVHKKKEADFPISCDIPGCERRFEGEIDLGWHKLNIHEYNRTATSLVCHECGKKCSTKAALTQHIRGLHSTVKFTRKTNPKRFVCEECGKGFRSPVVLETHQLSHSGPASWKNDCLFCGKKCTTKQLLMDHIRMHTNEKPYGCEYCGEEYAHGHNLRNHRNSKHNATITQRGGK